MQPDPENLLKRIDLGIPLIGLYDTPELDPFEPLVVPELDGHKCVFSFYENWRKGETLHLTRDNYGCGGAGHWLCGITTLSDDDFIEFLIDGEGLKASRELMEQWLDYR